MRCFYVFKSKRLVSLTQRKAAITIKRFYCNRYSPYSGSACVGNSRERIGLNRTVQ